jgi:hypothetical protein
MESSDSVELVFEKKHFFLKAEKNILKIKNYRKNTDT